MIFFFLPSDKNHPQEPSPYVDGSSSKNWSFLLYHQKNKEPQQGISLCSLVFRKSISFVGLWNIYAGNLSKNFRISSTCKFMDFHLTVSITELM